MHEEFLRTEMILGGDALEKLRRTGIALPGTPLRAGLQKQVEWLLSLAR